MNRAPDDGPLALRDADRLWCRVPEYIVALRAADPALALAWRHAVREVFTEAYAEGLRATAMSRDGWYLLTRSSCGSPWRDLPREAAMKLERVELLHVAIPLVTPFRTSFGTMTSKDTFLLHVMTDEAEGWSEFAADPEPLYCSEFVAGAEIVIRDFLLPRVTALPAPTTAAVAPAMASGQGPRAGQGGPGNRPPGRRTPRLPGCPWRFPRLGARSGARGRLGRHQELRARTAGRRRAYFAEGYLRIKLKIEPGWDVEPVRAVRERFGDALPLQVDANTAYTLADADHLRRLDDFGLLLVEEPLEENDLHAHARLQQRLRTPICLDESIHSARDAASAIALDACRVVNVKPARVGGYLEARRIHDVCAAHGVPMWCGGMLETGIGRAPNLALAALPGLHPHRGHLGLPSLLRRGHHGTLHPPRRPPPRPHVPRHRHHPPHGRTRALHDVEAGAVRGTAVTSSSIGGQRKQRDRPAGQQSSRTPVGVARGHG
ncbi:o-succinylbenzoate synthase [Streptomyces purpurascens]